MQVEELVEAFNNKKVIANAKNMMCTDSIDLMRNILIKKYGPIQEETGKVFKVADKYFPKPRIDRNRIGTFIVEDNTYYILTEDNKKSYGKLNRLVLKDENTLSYIVDELKNYRIDYNLVNE